MTSGKNFTQTISQLLNDFTQATGMSCIYSDMKGTEISRSFEFCRLCQKIRSLPDLVLRCYQSDYNGGLWTIKNKACTPYLCHAGIINFATPVICNEQLAGFILSGKVRTNEEHPRQIVPSSTAGNLPHFQALLAELPLVTNKEINSATRILDSLTHYAFPYEPEKLSRFFPAGHQFTTQESVRHHPLVQAVLVFIQNHLHEELTLTTLAGAVHLSPPYLSKLFKQEKQLTLTQYINCCRMEEAKLLLGQGQSLKEISQYLGYHQVPYFCRIFKQVTGKTPTTYKKELPND